MKNIRFILVCVYFVLSCSFLSAQEVPPPKAVFGLRITANYTFIKTEEFYDNYHVLSSQPAVFVEFNQKHEVHAGVILAHMINPSWYDHVYYQENASGLFIGYRYIFNEAAKNLRIFGQIDGSCTFAKFRGSSLGSGIYDHLSKSNLIGGHISFGADYKLTKHITLLAGVGAGFIITDVSEQFDKMLISPFLGIDYRF